MADQTPAGQMDGQSARVGMGAQTAAASSSDSRRQTPSKVATVDDAPEEAGDGLHGDWPQLLAPAPPTSSSAPQSDLNIPTTTPNVPTTLATIPPISTNASGISTNAPSAAPVTAPPIADSPEMRALRTRITNVEAILPAELRLATIHEMLEGLPKDLELLVRKDSWNGQRVGVLDGDIGYTLTVAPPSFINSFLWEVRRPGGRIIWIASNGFELDWLSRWAITHQLSRAFFTRLVINPWSANGDLHGLGTARMDLAFIAFLRAIPQLQYIEITTRWGGLLEWCCSTPNHVNTMLRNPTLDETAIGWPRFRAIVDAMLGMHALKQIVLHGHIPLEQSLRPNRTGFYRCARTLVRILKARGRRDIQVDCKATYLSLDQFVSSGPAGVYGVNHNRIV